MATVGTRNLTLADVSRRTDPDGKIAPIVEVLDEMNEIVGDMVMKECNDGTKHKTTVRTGIPSGTWRKLYGGVQSTKSSTAQIVDSCGMLEALPKIDADLVDKSGDPQGTLMSENMPHIEGLTQDVVSTMFYGDTSAHPERFEGLSNRYPNYTRATPDKDKTDYNVLNAGGSGSDNTSIWLVTWGDNALHALYPKGSKAGLQQMNLGKKLTTADDSSGDFMAYVTHYKWDIGLTLRDWRTCGRICNIDVSNLESESSAADLVKLMIKLSERVKGPGKRVWYMHERVRTMLRIQMLGAGTGLTAFNVNLTYENIEGKKVMMFDGDPVRTNEQQLLTESALTQAS